MSERKINFREVSSHSARAAGTFLHENNAKLGGIAFAMDAAIKHEHHPSNGGLLSAGAAILLLTADQLQQNRLRRAERIKAASEGFMDGIGYGPNALSYTTRFAIGDAGRPDITTVQQLVEVIGSPQQALRKAEEIVQSNKGKKEKRNVEEDLKQLKLINAAKSLPVYGEVFSIAAKDKRSVRTGNIQKILDKLQEEKKSA